MEKSIRNSMMAATNRTKKAVIAMSSSRSMLAGENS